MNSLQAGGWNFMQPPIAITRVALLHMIRKQKHCSQVICSAALMPDGHTLVALVHSKKKVA